MVEEMVEFGQKVPVIKYINGGDIMWNKKVAKKINSKCLYKVKI